MKIHHQNQSQRMPFAVLFVLLLPILSPHLFSPLSRSYPSLFSEWNAPKPRHLPLLKAALDRHVVSVCPLFYSLLKFVKKPSSLQFVTFSINLFVYPVGEKNELWSPLPYQGWKPCIEPATIHTLPTKSQGYIQVFLDGGLNQQRMGICDAVAVAKILNATLVIPHLEVNAVWQDTSSFADIFDVEHFIDTLSHDVAIVKEPPSEYSWSSREYYGTGIRATRIKTAPVHGTADWYLENVLPVLQSYGIAAIAPFSHRLAFDKLPTNIQRLRCKVNFHALAFVPHIRVLGDTLINRLRHPFGNFHTSGTEFLKERMNDTESEGSGKFVVLHLRFDKDMAAHSSCDFGGGKAERLALAKYRQVLWQGRVLNSQFTDEALRKQGRCPLTPEEIGLLLAALGFSNSTRLWWRKKDLCFKEIIPPYG
uniref:O-fucosyltransferase family protein n=1 Tax=Salix viminalis TaxID=40686 RepID=A0A6N2MHB0_SALVM